MRKINYALLAVLVIPLVQLPFCPAHYLGAEHDDAQYALGALSLLRGEYRLGVSPGDPPLTHQTPGLSALFVPAALLGGTAPLGFQLWAWAWLAGATLLVWLWLRPRVGNWPAAAGAAFVGLNPLLLSRAGVVMPEVPFLGLALGLLILLERERAIPGWLSGLWLAALWLLRPAALPLFGAVWLRYALRGERREAGTALVCALAPIAAWWLWVELAGSRLAEWAELSERLPGLGALGLARLALENARLAALLLGRSLLPALPGALPEPVPLALGALAAAAAAWGLWTRARRGGYDAALGFVLLSIPMHLFWPFWYERYLPPYLPFLALGLIGGGRRRAAALAVVALGALAVQGPALLRQKAARAEPELARTYAWIRARVPADAALAGAFFARDAFYTGRPFASLPGSAPFREKLIAGRVRFVLWQELPALGASLGAGPWAPALAELERALAGAGFRRVFADAAEGAAVYEVLR